MSTLNAAANRGFAAKVNTALDTARAAKDDAKDILKNVPETTKHLDVMIEAFGKVQTKKRVRLFGVVLVLTKSITRMI